MRIIFAGSSEYSDKHLEVLINLKNKCKIVGILTKDDKICGRGKKLVVNSVKKRAILFNIPFLQLDNLKEIEINKWIKSRKASCMIVVSFGFFFKESTLNIFSVGCFNFHNSLLPRWRGPSPIQYAIMFGDKKTGVSVIKMDSKIDTGDIVCKIKIKVNFDDTAETLSEKLLKKSLKILKKIFFSNVLHNRISFEKQNDRFATYTSKLKKIDGLINWNLSSIEINRRIKAFNPWPTSYFFLKSNLVKVWKSDSFLFNNKSVLPGTIVSVNKMSLDISTRNGILKIFEIQLMNRRKVLIKDFLKSDVSFFVSGDVIK